MSGHEVANTLLDAAKRDLKALGGMLDPEVFDDNIFGFHAQQAVEKALKSWLCVLQGSHPFTHDLSLLLRSLDVLGQDTEFCWGFLELGGYAVRFRYEDVPEGDEPLERACLVNDVRDLVEKVARLIPTD